MSAAVKSPWHEGELEAQRRAGVDPAYAAKVAPFLRPYLTEQHRDFYAELPFVVAGALDDAGRPWATLLQGDPGFLQATDVTRLHVEAEPDADDPASFASFLMSIASNAAASLGMMEHPVTRKREVDLELGKHWIDVLGMLEKKTRGNLVPQEQQILEGLLADLRMQFVSLSNATPKARSFSSQDITGG